MNEKLAHDDQKDEMIKTLREQAGYMKELISGQDWEIKDLWNGKKGLEKLLKEVKEERNYFKTWMYELATKV